MGKRKKRAHIVHMRDGERRQWRGGSGFVVAHGGERRMGEMQMGGGNEVRVLDIP